MTKENNFLKGAAILSIAGIIVKILGAIYRIPLSNIIFSEGMGYYQTAYPFYVLILSISTSGFPVAIARMVAERRVKDDYEASFKVFKIALLILSIVGLITSFLLFKYGAAIVNRLNNPNAYYALIGLAPALVFVPVMSAFRGYFQGMNDMTPTAISQVLEQAFRVGFGLFLALRLSKAYGLKEAAGGASLAGSIGAFFGTASILIIYFIKKRKIDEKVEKLPYEEESSIEIIKELFKIAIPISLGALILPVMDYLDIHLVLSRLPKIGFSLDEANKLLGNLKGMAQTLINLPLVFSMAISIALVPVVSSLKSKGDKEKLEETVGAGIKLTFLIGLPAAVGLFALSRPIISLLYYKNPEETISSIASMLSYLSMGVIFLTLIQTTTGILQGLARELYPARNLFIGVLVKALSAYFLLTVSWINIYGAAISTVLAYLVTAGLNIRDIKKEAININMKEYLLRLIVISLLMGLIARGSYTILANYLKLSAKISTLIAIVLAGLAYLILLLKANIISEEDISLISKSEKIISLYRKVKK